MELEILLQRLLGSTRDCLDERNLQVQGRQTFAQCSGEVATYGLFCNHGCLVDHLVCVLGCLVSMGLEVVQQLFQRAQSAREVDGLGGGGQLTVEAAGKLCEEMLAVRLWDVHVGLRREQRLRLWKFMSGKNV